MKSDSRRRSAGLCMVLALALGWALTVVPSASAGEKQDSSAAIINEPVQWDKALIKGEPNPVIRFAVAHQHPKSGCIGYLYISRSEIRYEARVPSSDQSHSFSFPRSSLVEARHWRLMGGNLPELELKFSNGSTYHFFRIRESMLSQPSLQPGRLTRSDIRSWEPMVEAINNFDKTVELAEKRLNLLHPQPPPSVTLNVQPGAIEKGHSAILTWKSENATKLDLQPGIGPVDGTGTKTVSPAQTTTYVLTARGPGGTNTATGRVTVNAPANPPTLILVDPSVTTSGQTVEVKTSPLSVRGVAMDDSGIPAVTINGAPAALHPKSTQAAEFTSDPLALKPGNNPMEIAATNAANMQTKVAFNVHFAPPAPPPPKEKPKPVITTPAPPPNPKALSKADILDLLNGDVPSARVEDLVKQYGLKFHPTEDDIKDIRAAGGDDDLIQSLEKASPPGSH